MSLDEDDENGSVESGSENDADEAMEDVDAEDDNGDGDGDEDGDVDGDGDGDNDEDGDNDDEEGDNEDEDDQDQDQDQDQDNMESPSQSTRHLPNGVSQQSTVGDNSNPTLLLTSPSPRPSASAFPSSLPLRPSVRPEALTAAYYDIVPTIAAPHSTSINTVTATPDMRWVFSGGSDGYIRKFNWPDTVNSKLMLTVAQRHPFVDSVTKAGVLLSYWENEEPTDRLQTTPRAGEDSLNLSPVYSLAVHNQALWLLSGLESGGINLQTVRHEEGRRVHTLRGHSNAVSVLNLSDDERSVLSGSWDKTINDWDLNTGQVKRKFATSGGQISAIECRPLSTLPVPQEYGIRSQTNGTFSSNNASRPTTNGVISNGVQSTANATTSGTDQNGTAAVPGSPEDSQASLFGDNGDNESLFGDSGQGPSGGGLHGLDDDDEFSRAIASELQHQQQEDSHRDIDMMDSGGPVQPPQPADEPTAIVEVPDAVAVVEPKDTSNLFDVDDSQLTVTMNGLPHSEEDPTQGGINGINSNLDAPPSSDTTFLDASMNGTIRVWDRRQPNPIARLVPPRSVPPWCMNACWSPDGNYIYAGRRNGTVDEYSLHKGLKEPRRSFKFPPVSGPVSAVKAMPNGRHLICASHDILRLYDLKEELGRHQATPFYIVPGHRTGVISQLFIDPTCRFMITTGGNRGWEGSSTEVLLGYEIGID